MMIVSGQHHLGERRGSRVPFGPPTTSRRRGSARGSARSPRDRHSLPLAAGEENPLAEHGVVAVGQVVDELWAPASGLPTSASVSSASATFERTLS
jgi:hypothetical protein